MKIAIVGAGSIGSTFALRLASSGHDVTVVARGGRLEQLRIDQAIVTVDGPRAAVTVNAALDPAVEYDRVLVPVLASQVGAVLPSLRASAAKAVMFMFNTFDALAPLRDAVGPGRFAFGFPAILASLSGGKLQSRVVTRGMVTTVTDLGWAKLFTDCGIPAKVEADMESWLRTHAALFVPTVAVTLLAYGRGAGVSWAEATAHARVLRDGLNLVRRLGSKVIPSPIAALSRAPVPVLAATFWALTRVKSARALAVVGPSECRTLIDAMVAADPNRAAGFRAIRP